MLQRLNKNFTNRRSSARLPIKNKSNRNFLKFKKLSSKFKGEITFENDTLLEGGSYGVMSNDVTYTEVSFLKKI